MQFKNYINDKKLITSAKSGKKEVRMSRQNKGNLIGSWAFLIGVLLALVLGLLGQLNQTWTIVLVAIGLIVGLLNIADEEATPFLMSGLALIIAAAFGKGVIDEVGYIGNIMQALLTVFVPATIVVAIRNVFSLARN